ncbi:hypothetical protein B0J13DRAFT_78620 [Dactylonectria estremocensis]|uniref:Uncharacterized protein n=1 Tax=Dactylonectria estremocensis TaxID=1079267 RepID=A0A9P9EGG9_9HYPO|nr:hypothetical protein B0J13DRAFT_78620 [Dactylonectria estremocensis]
MGNHYPSRRRDPRPEDDYPAYHPNEAYQTQDPREVYDGNPYQQYPPRNAFPSEHRSPPRSPPRRRKSERHRGAPSPHYYSDELAEPSRHRSERHSRQEEDRRGRSADPDRRGRGPSPSRLGSDVNQPRRHPRSSRHERDLQPERDHRSKRNARSERNARFIDPYDDADPYSYNTTPRHYPSDPREVSSRDRPRHSRTTARAPDQDAPPRGRTSRHIENDDDEYNATRRRRPRSQTRDRRDGAPLGQSPTRGRPPQTQRGRDGPAVRRKSMPASTKARSPWWQNPLLQAGARTALTAGAQAAMKSRNDPSPWMGAKGAKVATAALGAAIVDGFIGQKHPNSARQSIAREGVDLATGKVASGSSRHRR